ncbi:MAG: TetR family transcriptional regulator [Solirubrobacterales bacterium]|nr:TetR family transcriptional regulator [Solirubrobacterales bacterium]
MSPRPQIDHIRRPQLLAAAAEVIAERGVAATRIADVAERAGTSAPGVLYWFDSKDQLLAEALTAAEDRFDESLTGRLEAMGGPGERLRLLIEASAENYDWTLWMELWTRALRDPRMRATRQRLDDRWRGQIAHDVRAGQAAGAFADHGPPERIALILASLLDGLALQATLGDPQVAPAQMRDLALEIVELLLGSELPPLSDQESAREREMLVEGE